MDYQATQTAEFGDFIQLAYYGEQHPLYSVAVVLSNWAYESTWETLGASAGYNVPITLTLYDPGNGITPGAIIASSTVNAWIPWRPEPDAGCGDGWRASNGNCYGGSLTTVIFGFGGGITVPEQLIYGLAFNTQTWGSQPAGAPGPYNSLNLALTTAAPAVGTDPDAVYWNTMSAAYYTDHGAGGSGIFRADTGWAPYSPMIQFNTAEPASLALIGGGLLALGLARKRRWKAGCALSRGPTSRSGCRS